MTAANTVAYSVGLREEVQGSGMFSFIKLRKDEPVDRAVSSAPPPASNSPNARCRPRAYEVCAVVTRRVRSHGHAAARCGHHLVRGQCNRALRKIAFLVICGAARGDAHTVASNGAHI